MADTLKPSEVLDRAADLIEPEGAWTRFSYGEEGGPCCIVGALWRANGRNPVTGVAYEYLQRSLALGEKDPPSFWNDAPGRTQAEVVQALRKAAELARSEGQ